eukprot:6497452-Prymnesium_polylepis.1
MAWMIVPRVNTIAWFWLSDLPLPRIGWPGSSIRYLGALRLVALSSSQPGLTRHEKKRRSSPSCCCSISVARESAGRPTAQPHCHANCIASVMVDPLRVVSIVRSLLACVLFARGGIESFARRCTCDVEQRELSKEHLDVRELFRLHGVVTLQRRKARIFALEERQQRALVQTGQLRAQQQLQRLLVAHHPRQRAVEGLHPHARPLAQREGAVLSAARRSPRPERDGIADSAANDCRGLGFLEIVRHPARKIVKLVFEVADQKGHRRREEVGR